MRDSTVHRPMVSPANDRSRGWRDAPAERASGRGVAMTSLRCHGHGLVWLMIMAKSAEANGSVARFCELSHEMVADVALVMTGKFAAGDDSSGT